MDNFIEYLETIDNPDHAIQITEVLKWVCDTYPQLDTRVAWKQPMFTDHGTFIIGFSVSKNHFSVATEKAIDEFRDEIHQAGYTTGIKVIRVEFDKDVNYQLLKKLIDWNIENKKDIQTFWWN
ncbi:intracellular iron chaperone frataxin [Companilactobacillus sp. RD055328]|uniref:iron chaperone n=1 Tax=Companilactobacillus sp. RD055328 TaxID=2916634 RepID=UPI001FC8495C|nr:DUF1801 domain-containing protein [Companilactobacillus sp. RD055328]GKQ42347.1 intracellular iron chaperone frataxin [Companilactobacillus sp. RD055328]